jgi:hypothetical protein
LIIAFSSEGRSESVNLIGKGNIERGDIKGKTSRISRYGTISEN